MAEQLAIDGGAPVRSTPFPSWPVHGSREEELLGDVLRGGDWGEITGEKVHAFARQFASFQGAKYGVCVPSGTLALELAFQALGVGYGDEIITSAYTFIATPGAALTMGAKPVFVDIDPETNLIDPARIEAAITSKTKAIVPVHVGGQPADLDAVLEIGRRHGIPVLEDACQAWGAAWKGTPVGAIGDAGTFSFQASKNISAGEGGILVTNDPHLFDLAWRIHDCGRSPGAGAFEHEMVGRNLRMTEWQGAILLAQLERYPGAMRTRTRSAARLTAGLSEIRGLAPMKVDDRITSHGWHLYQVRFDPVSFGGRSRADFLTALRAEGIPCAAGYVPLPHQKAIRNALRSRFGEEAVAGLPDVPRAAEAGEHTVWLDQTVLLGTDEDMDEIVAACRKIQRAWS